MKPVRARLRVMPTGSSLDRAEACAASFVLPQAKEPASEASEFGTAVHKFMARAREVGRDEALAEIAVDATHYSFCEQIPWDKLPQGGRAEIAFAYNYETGEGRELGELKEARAYDVTDSEIAGTADLVGVVDATLHVYDWKWGYRTLTPAARALQLLFLAIAGVKAYDLDGARIAFFRLADDGKFFVDEAYIDAFDLELVADRLAGLMRRLYAAAQRVEAGEVLDVELGPHCQFCQAKASCPGQTSAALAVAGYKAPTELTPEIAAQAWAALELYDDISERARKQLREFAKLAPIPLPGGKEMRVVDWPHTKVDYTIAHAQLVATFGPELAGDAVKTSISQSAIEDVARKVASREGKKIVEIKKPFLEQLERARGLNRYTTPEVRVVKARTAK
jgi:hypothetical protein